MLFQQQRYFLCCSSSIWNRRHRISTLFPYTTLFRSHETVLQKTPYSFDVSVWELFWPLEAGARLVRSEEHTSELQSPCNLVCRLLLEKKKKIRKTGHIRREVYNLPLVLVANR